MTISLHRPGRIAAFVLGALLVSFALFGIAQAQTTVVQTQGCPQTCPSGQTCYQVTTGGESRKRCLTPSQVSAYGTQTAPATTPGNSPAGGGAQVPLTNPLKVNSLEELLAVIIDAAVYIGTIVLILALVYVGFMFVASRGNEEKIRDARRYFFWIVIGGLLVLGAKGLSTVIQSTANSLGSS